MTTNRETPTPPDPVAVFLTAGQSWIDTAADHYANAEIANADLADAYVQTSVEYPHGYVAGLHQTIGYHLKAGALAAAIAAAVVAEEAAR